MVNLFFDHITDVGIPYPNLGHVVAKPGQPQWYKFDNQWPYVSHFRPLLYFKRAGQEHQLVSHTNDFEFAWYPIAFGWFDFAIDYLRLIPEPTTALIRNNKLCVMFYYHEGDDPERIRERLDDLCAAHDLPSNCYRLISSNARAKSLERCFYFDDHEHFFRYINHDQAPPPVTKTARDLDFIFTCLVRRPSDWRLVMMADLWASGLLEKSQWSFNTVSHAVNLDLANLPLNLALIEGIQGHIEEFKSMTPKFCDELSESQHNDHTKVNADLYSKSMCNIVLETLYETEHNAGGFVTEKTWKCIKFGQPFVIVGAAGTLKLLREAGYRVFDSVIDNSYDEIADPTQRWLALKKTIAAIKHRSDDRAAWWRNCLHDVYHNQKLFQNRHITGLTALVDFMNHE